MVTFFGAAGGAAASTSKGKKGSADANYADFITEYAKSGKSKCRGCEDFIAKVCDHWLL